MLCVTGGEEGIDTGEEDGGSGTAEDGLFFLFTFSLDDTVRIEVLSTE